MEFEKDICCINFSPLIQNLDDLGKDISIISKRTGVSIDFLMNDREYIDLGTGKIIFSAVKELLDEKDPMIFKELGKQAIRKSSYGKFIDVAEGLGNLEEAVKFIPRFNSKFNDLFSMDVYEVTNGSGIVTIDYKKTKYNGEWIFDQCAWNIGNITGMPLKWNLQPMNDYEELCRFSLEDIFDAYSYLDHSFEMKGGEAYLDGKVFALPIFLGTESLKVSKDLLSLFSKKEFREIYCAEGCNTDFQAMKIVEDVKVSDLLTLKEGQVFGAPYCRYNLSWQKENQKLIPRILSYISRKGSAPLIGRLEDELEENKKQKQELIKANEEIKGLYDDLKRQHELERKRERFMTGGFAHEVRNALTGSKYQLSAIAKFDDDIVSFLKNNIDKEEGTVKSFFDDNIVSDDVYSYYDAFLNAKTDMKQIRYLTKLQSSVSKSDSPSLNFCTQACSDLGNLLKLKIMHKVVYGVTSDLERAFKVTDEIRAYSKLQEETRGNDEVNLLDIINNVYDSQKSRFEGIDYNLNLDNEFIVKGNPNHFDSIVKNLFLNSLDALAETKNKKLNVSVYKNEGQTYIDVFDNGSGIRDEDKEHIFDAFYSTKPDTGTGLGLPWSKRIIELYDGEIEFYSKPEGTLFRVIFNA